jgi:hypothetical protein
MEKDLKLISGDFQNIILPKEKSYILKAFRTEMAKAAVVYYYNFGNLTRFVQHTGFFCRKRVKELIISKCKKLEIEYKLALKTFDLEKMEKIKKGKLKIKRHNVDKYYHEIIKTQRLEE